MNESSPEPEWRLLPHDARGFFGLSEQFDRKELKRAYNRLLRRFKPEKHPAEFQRIRGAYEQLDLELRYGQAPAGDLRLEAAYDWAEPIGDSSAQSARSADPSHSASSEQEKLLFQRLEDEPPQDLYQEITKQEKKTPYDFFSLAILSDLVDRRDGMQFARWLLAGLKEFPHDAGLLHLTREYLTEMKETGRLALLLVACSKAVPSDDFYPLTESAWEQLVRNEPFEVFARTLKQSETNLRDISIEGKIAFNLRLLRLALWRDTGEWKDHAMAFLEENFDQIPPHLENELDLLSAVSDYTTTRAQFLNGDPIRERMDRALEDYFLLDPVEGDLSVVECQIQLSSQAESVLAAYPSKDNDDVEAMYLIWDVVSTDVAERYGDDQQAEVDIELWHSRTRSLLRQCAVIFSKSGRGRFWRLLEFLYGVTVMLIYIFVTGSVASAGTRAAVVLWPEAHVVTLFAMLLSIAAGILLSRWLSKVFRERIWVPACIRLAEKIYNTSWRREVLDFLNRSQMPFFLLRNFIDDNASDAIRMSLWVRNQVESDYGLAIFALTHKYQI